MFSTRRRPISRATASPEKPVFGKKNLDSFWINHSLPVLILLGTPGRSLPTRWPRLGSVSRRPFYWDRLVRRSRWPRLANRRTSRRPPEPASWPASATTTSATPTMTTPAVNPRPCRKSQIRPRNQFHEFFLCLRFHKKYF